MRININIPADIHVFCKTNNINISAECTKALRDLIANPPDHYEFTIFGYDDDILVSKRTRSLKSLNRFIASAVRRYITQQQTYYGSTVIRIHAINLKTRVIIADILL